MAKYKKKIELKRVNVNLPLVLVQRVEQYAEKKCLTVTNAYTILLNQALDQADTIDNLPIIVEAIKTAINESTLEQKQND